MGAVVCKPQPLYLIREEIHPNPLAMPSAGGVGLGLQKVMRYVYQVCAESDVYFMGSKLERHAGLKEFVVEKLLPGKQITTKPTGQKRLVTVYIGWLNVINVHPSTKPHKTFEVGPYGKDPVPEVRLYGNPRITFSSQGGVKHPSALASYHVKTRKLAQMPMKDIAEFIKQSPQQMPSKL